MITIKNNADDEKKYPFDDYEEDIIVSLMLDYPESVQTIMPYLEPGSFKKIETQYVVAYILEYFNQFKSLPTRQILNSSLKRKLSTDQLGYKEILEIVNRKTDPREIAATKKLLFDWTRSRAFGMLYDEENINKYKSGEYDELQKVFDKAKSIQEVGSTSLWFFDDYDKLFIEENFDKFSTGFPSIDKLIHSGGVARKEVFVFMAPTGVGKSIALINTAVANINNGKNVIIYTLELSDIQTAVRLTGCLLNLPVHANKRFEHKAIMVDKLKQIRNSGCCGTLVIQPLPPDETSVHTIQASLAQLKTRHFIPDVMCLDYLELMASIRPSDNKDEYIRQRAVTSQVRGLAIKENLPIFTATRTNRAGNDKDGAIIEIDKIADSYGKAMPIDYLVSIAQSKEEYKEGFDNAHNPLETKSSPFRIYVNKNRNGPKQATIEGEVNYATMRMEERLI